MMVEHSISKSTQPRSARRCPTLYRDCEKQKYLLGYCSRPCPHSRLADLIEQPPPPPQIEHVAEPPVGAAEPAVVPVQDGVAVEQVVDAGVLEDLVPVVIRVWGSRHSSVGNKSAYHSRNGLVYSGNPGLQVQLKIVFLNCCAHAV